MPENGKRFYEFGAFSLNEAERVLLKNGLAVPLGVKAFDTLLALVQRHGEIVERDTLVRLVWGDWSVSANNLDQQIKKAREALGRNGHDRSYIETVPGVGYRFAAEVTEKWKVESAASNDPARVRIGHRKLSVRTAILLCAALPLAGFIILSIRASRAHPGVVRYVPLTNDGKEKSGPLLSDGRRLIFEERIGGLLRAVSMPLKGGEPVPLNIPVPYTNLIDVSPDNGSIFFASRREDTRQVWAYSLYGGYPILLAGRDAEGFFFGLSPDEETAAFGGGGKLVLVGPGAKNMISVQLPGDMYGETHWAPDGKSIRFSVLWPGDARSVWEVKSDGRNPHRLSSLSSGLDQALNGTWSHDGRYYVYQAGSNGHQDLWVVRGRANSPVRLTNGPLSWKWPVFAVGNNTLFALGEHERGELDRYDWQAKIWRPLWNGIAAYELDYSRDKAWVVYVRFPDHTLWKSRPDGTGRVQLMPPIVLAHQPHWSPDGRKIAFMGQKKSGEWRVFLFPADGGPLEEALPDGEDQGVPTWSPDGKFIVFGDLLYRKPGPQRTIHLLDLRTHRATELAGSKGLWTPRWSPNGKYISALSYNSKSLSILDRKTSRWRELLRMNFMDNVMWSPDSRFIYFNAISAQFEESLFRVSVRSGRAERVVSLADAASPNENWYGVTPDGTPLALRNVAFQEVYALECILP